MGMPSVQAGIRDNVSQVILALRQELARLDEAILAFERLADLSGRREGQPGPKPVRRSRHGVRSRNTASLTD